MLEAAEAQDPLRAAGRFYDCAGASSAIMRLSNFPDEIIPLLQLGDLTAGHAIASYGCEVLVELGCYDGRALEVSRFAGVPYLGIDVDADAIRGLRQRIAEEGMRDVAVAMVADICDPNQWRDVVADKKPLHVLPFNLLGAFHNPAVVLNSMSEVGGIAVISLFNETPEATRVRRAYYANCGIGGLVEVPGDYGGVLFEGDQEFHSQSFSRKEFHALVDSCGGSVLRVYQNNVGYSAMVALRDEDGGSR